MNALQLVVAAIVLTALSPTSARADTTADTTAASASASAIAQAMKEFAGTAIVARGDEVIWSTQSFEPSLERDWPWASVTKQVVATLVMQQVEVGKIALDAPASTFLPAASTGAASPTIRQLLQHRAGLPNPEDSTVDAKGSPSFYTSGPTGLTWCLTGRSAPGGQWRYNNCDFIVLGTILERVTRTDIATLFARKISRPLGMKHARFVRRGERTPNLASGTAGELIPYGAAGALIGRPRELLAFDRALLTGKLLSAATRADMWAGDPALGFMALGQWSFSMTFKGCASPARIIERRGAIGKTQVRNIMLPDQDISAILFISDSDYDFGEIWQGKGLSHDVLAAAACVR